MTGDNGTQFGKTNISDLNQETILNGQQGHIKGTTAHVVNPQAGSAASEIRSTIWNVGARRSIALGLAPCRNRLILTITNTTGKSTYVNRKKKTPHPMVASPPTPPMGLLCRTTGSLTPDSWARPVVGYRGVVRGSRLDCLPREFSKPVWIHSLTFTSHPRSPHLPHTTCESYTH